MTTYAAYNAGLPCKNSACKSYGKPHPNCRCWGEMAEGGEVEFCSSDRAHQADCEYFAEGGQVNGTDDPPPVAEDLGTDEPPPGMADEGGTDEPPPGSSEASPSYSAPTSIGDALTRLGGSGLLQGETPAQPADGERITPDQMAMLGKQNEDAARIAGLVTGAGVVGAAAKASEAMVGSKIIQQAIQGGLIQTTDEVSKWLMGEENPEGAAGSLMAIGANTLFSGFFGAASEGLSKGASLGMKKLAEEKFGKKALSFLSGLGYGASRTSPGARSVITEIASKGQDGLDMATFKQGMNYFDKLAAPAGGALIGATSGWHEDGVLGALTGAVKGALYGQGAKFAVKTSSKVLAPALLKVLSSGNVKGIAQAIDHAAQVAHGSKIVDRSIESLFSKAPALSSQAVSAYGGDKLKRDLDMFLGKGGMDQSVQEQIYDMQSSNEEPEYQYAEGGDVKKSKRHEQKDRPPPVLKEDDGVSIHYPAQNMLLSAARGRVSNYLKGMRPQANMPRLPFDDEPDTRQAKKSYDRALNIAVAPLSVMHEIQKGTIEPEHIKHLNAMYPELTSLLQKRATQKIVEAQLSGKKPPYKIRQGLSLLMGASLSSEMTPQSIQAAQSVFANKNQQQPAAPKQGGGSSATSKLSKSDQAYLTGSQARQKRAQRPS